MESFLRNYATPLSLVGFAAVSATGIMMLLGLRGPLGAIHEWSGILFVIFLVLHLARNRRGVSAMLAVPRNRMVVGALGAAAAVLIIAALPLSSGGHGHGRGFHGGFAVVHRLTDAPIAKMAPALGLTGEQAIVRLRKGGVAAEGPQQSLNDIAESQNEELPRLLGLVLGEEPMS